jgi:hypothetical protein
MFESGMNLIESGQHGTLRTPAHTNHPPFRNVTTGVGIQSEQWRRIVFVAQSVNPGNEPRNPLPISSYCSIRYFSASQ